MNAVTPNLWLEQLSTAPALNKTENRASADQQIASGLGPAMNYFFGVEMKQINASLPTC